MGFFNSLSINNISDFVSGNVQSAVKDTSHLAQQVVNNPVTSSLAPTALSAFGIPPSVYNAVKNLQNSGLNSLQGIKEASAGSEYSEEIKGLTEDDFKAISKKIEEDKKIEEEKKKEEEQKKKDANKKTLYLIIGGILLVMTASFVTYKIANKKQ